MDFLPCKRINGNFKLRKSRKDLDVVQTSSQVFAYDFNASTNKAFEVKK
jgi:hypothetical protein